jgi:hypothetical protein
MKNTIEGAVNGLAGSGNAYFFRGNHIAILIFGGVISGDDDPQGRYHDKGNFFKEIHVRYGLVLFLNYLFVERNATDAVDQLWCSSPGNHRISKHASIAKNGRLFTTTQTLFQIFNFVTGQTNSPASVFTTASSPTSFFISPRAWVSLLRCNLWYQKFHHSRLYGSVS